jgi:protein-S-isoprenylcysteine O-methyltransferase Ste14
MTAKTAALLVMTLILACISRASLRDRHSHGFYRFFAWEAIVGLFLLNVGRWFENPFARHQLAAWILLFSSIVPAVWGTMLLRQRGKPVAKREGDPNLLAFERTSVLVTTGIYGYIRHPLYSSLLLLTWGIFFKLPSFAGGALAAIATGFLFLTALADEAECTRVFGPEYEAYMTRTRRFIPFVL